MAVEVTVKQKGLFKKPLTEAEQWKKDGAGVLTGAVYPICLEPEALDRLKDSDLDGLLNG